MVQVNEVTPKIVFPKFKIILQFEDKFFNVVFFNINLIDQLNLISFKSSTVISLEFGSSLIPSKIEVKENEYGLSIDLGSVKSVICFT